MLDTWTLFPAPSEKDPRRHALLVRADMTDIHLLVRQFGVMCGRPQKERAKPDYNYSIYLHNLTESGLQLVQDTLARLSPDGRRPPPSARTAVKTDFLAAPEPFKEPEPVVIDMSGVAPPALGGTEESAGPPGIPTAPAPADIPPMPEAGVGPPIPILAARPSAAPPVPASEAGPPVIEAEPPGGALLDISSPSAPPSAVPAPAPAAMPAPQPPAAGRPEKPLWGASIDPDPAFTFDTLSVGSYNRFAHAASMAVVANPGTMYNPLFLYGAPGVGKSHVLASIGRAIQEQTQGEPVFFTTGPRLSRAVRQAAASGRMGELEAFVRKSRAVMIDDIHLMTVSDKNQAGLRAVLEHYFTSSKHVAMTSVYPPHALGSLEEALKFQIGSGWAVEMKVPNPDTQKAVVLAGVSRLGLEADNADATAFLERLGPSTYEVGRWLRRLKALSEVRSRVGQGATVKELLPVLFIPDLGPESSPSADEISRLLGGAAAPPPPDGTSPKSLAVFFPRGCEPHAQYMTLQFHATVKKNGLSYNFRQAAMQAYDPEQLYGVPFAIGDLCDYVGADAALMLAPNPGSGLAGREGELHHALERILSGLDIPLGWINFTRVKEPGPYFRAFLDLFAVL